jgi:hypothetical protein
VAPPKVGDPWNPGSSSLRRLTKFEYVNTVTALLQGDDAGTAAILPDDDFAGAFDTNSGVLEVSDRHIEKYVLAADAVAAAALVKIDRLAPCDQNAAGGAEGCARVVAKNFGRRVFRRPITDDEVSRLVTIYRAGATGATHVEGLRWLLKEMFQSPYFLYHVQLGVQIPGEPRLVRLSHHELASRLSYFLWASLPDDALFAAADQGLLGTADQVARQARQMLADPRARQGVGHFFDQWLDASAIAGTRGVKVPGVYNGFDALRPDLRTELATFVERTFFDSGKFETLLTAPYSFVNARLAALYGVAAPTQPGFTRVELDPRQRAGILTQGAFLAAHAHPDQSSPVLRGNFVRERLLCGQALQPPPGVAANPPMVDPNQSARQQIETLTSGATCQTCHQLFNPIGFALENFDAVGRWRTSDGGKPVNASGQIVEFPTSAGPFNGPVELAQKLAQSPDARSCVVEQFYQYAASRWKTDTDGDTVAWLARKFADSQQDMRELVIAATVTPAFQFKLAADGGSK